jgi:hypothetical protein
MNLKKIKYSAKKARKAVQLLQLRMFLFLMLIVAIPATIVALTEIDLSKEAVSVVGGTTFASMLAIGNIEDVNDREVAGEAINYKVWLISLDQIDDSVPFPSANALREVGAVPLKPGQKLNYFVAHDIPTFGSSGERGDLTISPTNTFTIIMGGVRDQLLNFIEEYAGGKFIVIFQECESGEKFIIGSPCKPMVLQTYALKNDKENRSVTFTFANKSIRQYYKYTGSVSGADAVLHPAGNTTLTIQPANDTYRIPDGSSETYAIASVAGLSSNDEGRYITLFGEGSDNSATIAEVTGFVLKNGATWTAHAGSQITFRVFDQSTLIEVSRIQTT